MRELVQKWRAEADAFATVSRYAEAMRACAADLERLIHIEGHDGTWETDGSCPYCEKEMEAQQ